MIACVLILITVFFVILAALQIFYKKSLTQLLICGVKVLCMFILKPVIRQLRFPKKCERKNRRVLHGTSKKERINWLDVFYYTLLTALYIYCSLQTLLYILEDDFVIALFFFVIEFFAIGHLKEIIAKFSNSKFESIISGALLILFGLCFLIEVQPSSADCATLCYNIAMLIVIVEQLLPIDENAKRFAYYLERGETITIQTKYSIKMTGLLAGLTAIIAQYTGTLLTLSNLDLSLALNLLAAWLVMSFGAIYIIHGQRLLHWRNTIKENPDKPPEELLVMS